MDPPVKPVDDSWARHPRRGSGWSARRSRLAWHSLAVAAAALLCATPAAAWQRPHSDPGNTGFVDVVTAPAAKPSQIINGIGSFAPGVGPVTAADGTVYIGNEQGTLMAFTADGSPAWSRPIGSTIVASAAVGSDGSIYVVSTGKSVVTDHRVEPAKTTTVYKAFLSRLNATGGLLWTRPFPGHDYDILSSNGARTTAPPNIVTNNGVETVIVPAVYRTPSGQDFRLIAFTTGGAVAFDQKVTFMADEIVGGVVANLPAWAVFDCTPELSCWYPVDADLNDLPLPTSPVDRLPVKPNVPLPGVAVFTFEGGGLPWVLVSDHFFDLVGYTFDPGVGFNEIFRRHNPDKILTSPPTALPDGHSFVGTIDGRVLVAGPNGIKLPEADLVGAIYGAPTRTADGGIVVTGLGTRKGFVSLLRNGQTVADKELIGQTIAAAAASRTHIFVSTASSFFTFDTALQQVNELSLPGGGLAPPAIGPAGHVYALASNILFVYPPPAGKLSHMLDAATAPVLHLQDQAVAPEPAPPQPTPPQPGAQTFKPPLTKSGKRLYACQDFDGHGCGAPVAAAFCQQQGFAQAAKLDTQTEKAKAETLDGRACDKKKCKVFSLITCSR
jgi:outer membrane protein assembly factor BamB